MDVIEKWHMSTRGATCSWEDWVKDKMEVSRKTEWWKSSETGAAGYC